MHRVFLSKKKRSHAVTLNSNNRISNKMNMKNFFYLMLFVSPFFCYAQDKNTSPLHSYEKLTFNYKEFTVIDYYITLDSNINNEKSRLFISKKPAPAQILDAALNTISDSFVVIKNNDALYTIIIGASPYDSIKTVELKTGKQNIFTPNFKSNITANRAIEIVSNGYDKRKGSVVDGVLLFNNKKLTIISNSDIKTEISSIINNLQANK